MTNIEMATTIQAVINTLDKGLSITGIQNAKSLIGCAQALEKVCESLSEKIEEDT